MRAPILIACLILSVAVSLCDTQSETSPANADSLLACANRCLARENTDSARALFTSVLSSTPHAYQAQIGLIRVKMAEKDWQGAASLCDKLLRTIPDDLAVHYLDGICERERAFGDMVWTKSRRHFEAVLAKDSLYRDVLYQYALLMEWQDELPWAIGLALRQVRLRPDLVEAQAGLMHLYRHYISVTNPVEALQWLRSQDNDYSRFYSAEVLRRTKQFVQAESTLFRLQNQRSDLPPQAYDLSLAHIYAMAGNAEAAQNCYWEAVDGITSWMAGALVFEELKYIISDEELAQYRSLFSDRLKRAFFHRVWEARDPMPATAINYRLIEHLQRYAMAEEQFEYFGPRLEITNPDRLHTLKLPRAFSLNKEFNDLGIVFMRQGPPNSIERTMGNSIDEGDRAGRLINAWDIVKNDPTATPMSKSRDQKDISKSQFPEANTYGLTAIDPHQAWIYYASADEPQRIIHFALRNTARNYWRLTPLPGQSWNLDDELLEKLETYDVEYSRLLKAPRQETTLRAAVLEKHEKEVVAAALTTDRHVWSNGTIAMSIPHAIDAFRNPAGGTLLDVSYAIPYEQLVEAAGPKAQRLSVEVGLSTASCANNRVIDSRRDTLTLPLTPDGKGSYVGLFRQIMHGDSVKMTAHVRALAGQAVGTWSERLRVPAFAGNDFMISDLQLLMPASHGPVIEINGVKVEQSPFKSYTRARPLYVYIQVYNLVEDIFRAARFTATFTIAPLDVPDAAKVLAEVTRDLSDETNSTLFEMLDIKGVDPGKYLLTARVTDRKRVQTITRSREVEITR